MHKIKRPSARPEKCDQRKKMPIEEKLASQLMHAKKHEFALLLTMLETNEYIERTNRLEQRSRTLLFTIKKI